MLDSLRQTGAWKILKGIRRVIRKRISLVKRRIRRSVTLFANRHVAIRPYLRWQRRVVAELKYRLRYCLFTKIDPKVIFFESFIGRSYSDNPRAIYEYLLTDPRFNGYTFVWAFRKPALRRELPELERAEVVKIKSRRYFRYCAMAGTWVSNSRMTAGLVCRDKQNFIQTWHGTPLKRLGHDLSLEGNAMNTMRELHQKWVIDTRKYTTLLSYSPFTSEKFRTAFALDKLGLGHIMREVGMPRNDMLVRAKDMDRARCKARLGISADKKVILYAPTWRDNQHEAGVGYTYKNKMDFTALREALGDEYVVLFRAHYFVSNSFDFEAHAGFVINASHYDDIAQLYPATDMLITDYSSSLFDYAILDRPILLYMYDLEEYRDETRGFYISTDEMPGPVTQTMPDLIESIRQAEKGITVPPEKLAAFKEKFLPLDDGEVSRRVAEIILEGSI